MVESSELPGSNYKGIRAFRKIRMYDGKEAKEKIIDYKEGKFIRMEFLDHGMSSKKIEVEFTVKKKYLNQLLR